MWTPGDVSGSQTLTALDHLYAGLINELRIASDNASLATVYNVKAYGAQGNGTTDDTTAIQKAITACSAAYGGIVFFPPGSYCISGTLAIPPLYTTVESGPVIFRGSGFMQDGFYGGNPYATCLIAKSLAGDMFSTSQLEMNAVAFEDMSIYGQSAGVGATQSAGSLIHIYNWMEGWARNLELDGPYLHGFFADNHLINGQNTGSVCDIQHLRVEHGGAGNGAAIQLNNMIMGAVRNVHAEAMAYGIVANSGSAQMTFSDNSLQSCTVRGMQIQGNQQRIIGNITVECGKEGMYVQGKSPLIIGNHIVSNGLTDATVAGLHLGGATTNAIVTGNQSSDDGAGTQHYGFLEDGAGNSGNAVYGNDFTGNITSAVKGSTSATFRSNLGYNPLTVSAPAFPATTVSYTNTTGVDVYAYISNGTSPMSTTVNGNTGPSIAASGNGTVFIPAGGTFVPTYGGGSPSWVFQGN